MCRKRLSSPGCRSELIDSAWVVIVSGQKMHKNKFLICVQISCHSMYTYVQSLRFGRPKMNGSLTIEIAIISEQNKPFT